MKMNKSDYKKYVEAHRKKSPVLKNCLIAFIVGGSICLLGEILTTIYLNIPFIPTSQAPTLTSVTLIFLSVLLTGLGIYEKIAKHAGAGTLLPITGFANSVASTAIEFKKEGQVFGIGCKIFTIAGPVILYGIFSSWLLGVIYWMGKILGVV